MKYCVCIGTKAELIKMAPIMLEFDRRNIEYLFVSTGQHFLDDLAEQFGLRHPDVVINPKNGFKGDTGGAFGWALKSIPGLAQCFKKHDDMRYILVHGDTMSTFIGAIAGKLSRKVVCHVEAGLRSRHLKEPFPEEIVRTIVDKISAVKFAPSEKTAKKFKSNSMNVGNTSMDSLRLALEKNDKPFEKFKQPYVVATIHRHENIKSKERMNQILKILGTSNIRVYWFIHENAKHKLKEYGLYKDLKYYKKLNLIAPMNYLNFVHVMKGAQFVFTDGGSMSEECAELNVPCILLRNATERDELLERWDQVLTKLDYNVAKSAIDKFSKPRDKYKLFNPYNKGNSSKNIIDILINLSM
jgi:UDP-N-acetylglucosamine 2-epimerase (non-hydrolysing)